MTYRQYLETFIGKEGSLYHDHGIFYIRFEKSIDPSKGPIYRITEVHDDFAVVKTEKAEVVKAEDLVYVLPLTNLYIVVPQ